MGKISENLKVLRGYIGSRQITTTGPGKIKYLGLIKVFLFDEHGARFDPPVRGYLIRTSKFKCLLPIGELEMHSPEHFREVIKFLKTEGG